MTYSAAEILEMLDGAKKLERMRIVRDVEEANNGVRMSPKQGMRVAEMADDALVTYLTRQALFAAGEPELDGRIPLLRQADGQVVGWTTAEFVGLLLSSLN